MPPLTRPTITEGIWDVALLIAWLHAIGADLGLPLVPGTIGEALPAKPDRLGVVTDTSGGPLQAEGLLDQPMFQLRWRGRPGSTTDAGVLAHRSDRIIIRPPRLTLHGVTVFSAWRVGGRPTALTPNPSPGLRSEFTCTYGVLITL